MNSIQKSYLSTIATLSYVRSVFTFLKPDTMSAPKADVEQARAFIIVEILEYIPNSVVIKTIIRKTTGNVSAVSFDSGEALAEKISPFETFIQIIEGEAEVMIEDKSHFLKTGESFIIPEHVRNTIKANVRFKMISTIIKNGYDEVTLN